MPYQSPPVGNRITCVFHGLDRAVITDNNLLEKSLTDALNIDEFEILGIQKREFKPHGLTINFLLAESHCTLHTYPEYFSLTFDLYSCRGPKDGRKTYEHLKKKLNPKEVRDYKEDPVIVDPNYQRQL